MRSFLYNVFRKLPIFCVSGFSMYIFITLLINVIFDNKVLKNHTELYYKTPNYILIVASIILVGICCLLLVSPFRKMKLQISDRKFILLIGVCFLAIFGVQLFITSNIWFYTGWDVKMIVNDAMNITSNNTNEVTAWYYSTYPNNLVLVYVLSLILKFGKIFLSEPYIAVLWVNCFSVCISLFLAILCIFKLTKSRRVTVLGMCIGACLIALSPWIVIPYSDTLGMVFPVLCLFLYLYIEKYYLKCLLCAISAAIGFLIKPTVIIIFIAICIVELCRIFADLTQENFQYKSIVALMLAIVLFFLSANGIKKLVYYIDETEFNESIEFSMEHYFMMGTNVEANGGYASEDVSLSYSFADAKQRKKNNIDVAISRIKEMGPIGYVKHLIRKNISTYNDGTFYWGKEGTFFDITFVREGKFPDVLKNLYYKDGENFGKFCTVEQIIWFYVLICICFCFLSKKSTGEILISIGLIGVSVFLLLFEARSRYLLIYSPLYITLASIGISKLSLFIKNHLH